MAASIRALAATAYRTFGRIASGSNRGISRPSTAVLSLSPWPSPSSPRPLFSSHVGPAAAATARIHTTARRRTVGHNKETVPDSAPTTDFDRMDMLGQTPAPATSVDVCMSDGFVLNSGITILGGAGALLVAGDAFEWRPWRPGHRLLNDKGQWDLHPDALGVLALVWPRPDLLVLGLGPDIRPLSPDTRRLIASLGMRVEVLDTRNAASQFNMLATERGVRDVAAALVPIGWREGIGAV